MKSFSGQRSAFSQRGQSVTEFAVGLFILALLALVAWAAAAPLFSQGWAMLVSQADIALDQSHAVAKHGTGAVAADECFQQNGTYEIWSNPTTGRQANICHVPDGKWYIQVIEQIDGKWQEITKFAKDKMVSYEQVAQYLRNCGYIPPQ